MTSTCTERATRRRADGRRRRPHQPSQPFEPVYGPGVAFVSGPEAIIKYLANHHGTEQSH